MAKAPSTSNDFAPSWLNFTDNIYSKPTAANRNNIIDKKKEVGKRKTNFSSSITQNPKSSVRDVEFPSLNDKSKSVKQNGFKGSNIPSLQENVWSKPPSLKSVQASNIPTVNSDVKSPSAIYKSLVPKATSCAVKAYKRSLSANSSPSWSPNSNKPKENVLHSKAPPVMNNPSADYISNVQVLKRSKIRQRKAKSDFLTEIRQDSDDTNNSSEDITMNPPNGESPIKIPINRSCFNTIEDEQQLSSSLEAEHRLLKQMGWSSSDEQPLTEEEIQEYFLKHEMNSDNMLISQVQKKQELISALAEWSCSQSENKSTSSLQSMGNNTESNPMEIIYDAGLGKDNTDSDLSSLEDDLI